MQTLHPNEMVNFTAGGNLSKACGVAVGLSVATGGIGALIFGPSAIGLCIAAAIRD
ncbi:hypothetical protein [Chitinophaga sp.]|uniref:hypothetical protein n=1 Tax=Chitinophaga sp. TaxID=1869181 RepID=UPI0031CE54AA